VKLLDVSQLSEVINVKKKTIYDWTHKKQIPHVKMGRLLRFDLDDIEKWIRRTNRSKRSGY
jgi:excisionase family DNA binding protein